MSEHAHPSFDRIRAEMAHAPFVAHLGIQLEEVEDGRVVTRLNVRPEHAQSQGFVHAGVMTTLADHTTAAAASTLLAPDRFLLSVEFKVNLLRPATGPQLRCRAEVVRSGKTVSVIEGRVYSVEGSEEKLVMIGLFTMTSVAAAASPR